jgi:hypothetical protein
MSYNWPSSFWVDFSELQFTANTEQVGLGRRALSTDVVAFLYKECPLISHKLQNDNLLDYWLLQSCLCANNLVTAVGGSVASLLLIHHESSVADT